MLNDENKRLCGEVLDKYGYSNQLLKLGEECTELAQAIFRLAQGEIDKVTVSNLVEEFIDVYVVQEQILQHWKGRDLVPKRLFNELASTKLIKALEKEELPFTDD